MNKSDIDSQTALIYKAYDIIGSLTPVKGADCGKLCEKRCCKGDEAGMLLFPGEEIILAGITGFNIEKMVYMETPGINILFCDGCCKRETRPLACRIFPVAPSINKDDKDVTAVSDIRGRRMCPIYDLKYADPKFIQAVAEAFNLLAQDKSTLDFMNLISSEINELKRFYKK